MPIKPTKYKVKKGSTPQAPLKVHEHEFPFKEMQEPGHYFFLKSDDQRDFFRLNNRYRDYRKHIDPDFKVRVDREVGGWKVTRV